MNICTLIESHRSTSLAKNCLKYLPTIETDEDATNNSVHHTAAWCLFRYANKQKLSLSTCLWASQYAHDKLIISSRHSPLDQTVKLQQMLVKLTETLWKQIESASG
jgi:hypothetical protein